MNYLLDTCTFLWLETNPSQVSPRATALINDPANTIWLSVTSVWEVIVKVRIGKLVLQVDVEQMVQGQVDDDGTKLLDLKLAHVLVNRSLPLVHHDPFDRMLVCQALAEGLTILTPDHHIRQYPVPTEW